MTRADTHLGNWRLPPNNRWAFNHVREIVPTARVPGSRRPVRLPRRTVEAATVAVVAPDGRTVPLHEVIGLTFTDALMVLRQGTVIHEWYAHADAACEPHILFSVSKSLTGALAGCLVADGLLDVEAPVGAYVPEVAGSAYGDATVRHVLDMTVSLDFEENYLDQAGAFARYRRATGWNPSPEPADLRSFLAGLGRLSRPHGQRFAYQSPNSDLLGWILERAARRPFAALLSERIWQPLGAGDAEITVDRLGAARTAGGICATIGDLALFGEMMRNRGLARSGRPIVPGFWIDDIRSAGDRQAWRDGDLVNLFPAGRYRSQWYETGNRDAFAAVGIHGQWIYVDPQAAMVVVKQSSQPTPVDDALDQLTLASFVALAQAFG